MNAPMLVLAMTLCGTLATTPPPPGHPAPATPSAPKAADANVQPATDPRGGATAAADTSATPLYPIVEVVPDSSVSFALQAGSRLYPDWKEDHRVRIGERFLLGDTPSSAEVRRFLPAFLIVDGKKINTSRDMLNPAVQIFVYEEGAVTDSTWAFLNFPPHFSARSFFTFQLKSVEGYGGGGS
jgi:hypothetical protein